MSAQDTACIKHICTLPWGTHLVSESAGSPGGLVLNTCWGRERRCCWLKREKTKGEMVEVEERER